MAYMALPHEVQTADLILEAQRQHKRVAVPLVTQQGLVALECPPLVHIEGGTQTGLRQFRQGPYGILEPSDTSAVIPLTEIDFVWVPGVGFDAYGTRLGYGAGYYDRFLKQLPVTTRYGGLAFHTQLVSDIPSLPHDVPMPFVVTEQGKISCSPHAQPPGQPRDGIDTGEHR